MLNEDHPQDWPVTGAQRRGRQSKGKRAHRLYHLKWAPALLQAGAGSVQGDSLGRFPEMAGTVSQWGKAPAGDKQPSRSPAS